MRRLSRRRKIYLATVTLLATFGIAFGAGYASRRTSSTSRASEAHFSLAHWNVYNLGGDYSADGEPISRDRYKSKSQAMVIQEHDWDIIALTELGTSATADQNKDQAIVNLTNDINARYEDDDPFSYIQMKTENTTGRAANQYEYNGFIYKHDVFDLRSFSNGKKIEVYNNPDFIFKPESDSTETWERTFVRPPVASKFRHKETGYDFTYITYHADSPSNHPRTEAEDLHKVVDFFDNINGNDTEFFIGGDTNIRESLHGPSFQNLLDIGFENHIAPDVNTSLSTIEDKYANSYDKMFSTIKYTDSGFVKDPGKNKGVFDFLDIKEMRNGKWSELYHFLDQNYPGGSTSWWNGNVKMMSDHIPTYIDVKMTDDGNHGKLENIDKEIPGPDWDTPPHEWIPEEIAKREIDENMIERPETATDISGDTAKVDEYFENNFLDDVVRKGYINFDTTDGRNHHYRFQNFRSANYDSIDYAFEDTDYYEISVNNLNYETKNRFTAGYGSLNKDTVESFDKLTVIYHKEDGSEKLYLDIEGWEYKYVYRNGQNYMLVENVTMDSFELLADGSTGIYNSIIKNQERKVFKYNHNKAIDDIAGNDDYIDYKPTSDDLEEDEEMRAELTETIDTIINYNYGYGYAMNGYHEEFEDIDGFEDGIMNITGPFVKRMYEFNGHVETQLPMYKIDGSDDILQLLDFTIRI